jgi:predicted RNase H-like HicB family nuclease
MGVHSSHTHASQIVDNASMRPIQSRRRRTSLPRCRAMKVLLKANFQLFGIITKQDGLYIAHCPPLDITTQGSTENEAKKNLAEASELFVVSCFERGTFEQALRELGWHVAAGHAVPQNGKSSPLPRGGFQFPVPVPFGFEKAAGCPA